MSSRFQEYLEYLVDEGIDKEDEDEDEGDEPAGGVPAFM